MAAERDDLEEYIDLIGYNPKYGITGRKLRQLTYLPPVVPTRLSAPRTKGRRHLQ